MEIQKQILLFFASIQTPVLDTIVQFITMFGEEYITVAIITFMYWNISKKKGFCTCMSMISASQVMSLTKAIVRFPRPWKVIDGLSSVRQSTATGYSFPSGHTSNAAATLSSVAVSFKKRWLSILCAVMIVLVGLSRLYLCVHWPMDVACGLLIGIGSTMLLYNKIANLFDDKAQSEKIISFVALFSTLLWIILALLLQFTNIDAEAFTTFAKNVAMASGVSIGFVWERKKTDYTVEDGHWKRKILRFVLGIAGAVIILPLSKILLKQVNLYCPITAILRYALVTLWASGIFPILGCKVGLFETQNACCAKPSNTTTTTI